MRIQDVTGDPKLMRQLNRSAVLGAIRREEPISRARIARLLHLARPTVSEIVSELIDLGLVVETGQGESRVGRKPTLLELNIEDHLAVGLNLGVTQIEAAVVDLRGAVLATASVPTGASAGEAAVLERMKHTVSRVMSQSKQDKIVGLGVAVLGLVDDQTGINTLSTPLGWRNVPIKHMFQDAFGLPTWVENNANAMALGEKWFGCAKDVDGFVWIHVGTGVGAGIFLMGELYRGEAGGAGEIGHTTVVPDGPLCTCGNRGCLTVLSAGPAIAERAKQMITSDDETMLRNIPELTPEVVSWAANAGDGLAKKIIQDTGTYLGIGIANLINTFNLSTIILGGGVAKAGEIFLEAVRAAALKRAMAMPPHMIRILPSSLGDDAGTIGAATVAFQGLFRSPESILHK